jgi:thiol-disulfide isomerase/thioredoxin
MIFLHIVSSKEDVEKLNKYIEQGKDVFILLYMEGCGPCEATRPEWAKIKSNLGEQYKDNNDVVIVDMNKDLAPLLNHIGSIDGFPTMKYINNKGDNIETYESSSIKNKDRSVDSFVNWIESKITKVVDNGSPKKLHSRLSKKKNLRSKKGKSRRSQKGGRRTRRRGTRRR